MANYLAKKGQKMAFKVLYIQSAVVLIISISTLLLSNSHSALAVLFGGLMNILPNAVFALLAFRYSGASQNELVVRSFSQGAKLKMILTVILAVIAFYGLNLAPLVLFSSFIVMTLCHWVATVIVQTTTER
ncbi:ATP synthase subunit I [Aliiglaciecola litoralis]